MVEKIEPALSEKQWAEFNGQAGPSDEFRQSLSARGFIAVYNALLRDDDPRKITREIVATLREAADTLPDVPDETSAFGEVESYLAANLRRIAAALESYLPPESS